MSCYLKAVVHCVVVVCLGLVVWLIPIGRASGALQRHTSGARKVDELFNKNCARCHGADGRGDTPAGHTYQTPDLTTREWWKKNSGITGTRSLRSIVARGKGGMPAFGKKLNKSEINLLVDRMRRFRQSERKS
jgi:cytochrome c5